jgi:hypothetical protein
MADFLNRQDIKHPEITYYSCLFFIRIEFSNLYYLARQHLRQPDQRVLYFKSHLLPHKVSLVLAKVLKLLLKALANKLIKAYFVYIN